VFHKLGRYALVATAAAALAACGGGDGGDTATSTPPARFAAEGLWTNQYGGVLVTSTGEFWGLEDVSNVGWVLYQGQASASGSNISGSGNVYYGFSKASGTVAGSFTSTTLTVTLSSPALGSQTVTLAKNSQYDQSPNLAGLAGTYASDGGARFILTSNGSISGSNGDCTFTGTARVSDDGKNYLRFSLNYSSRCGTLSGKSSNGVVAPISPTTAYYGEKLNDGSLGDGGLLTKLN
jgi:hypothetical protein